MKKNPQLKLLKDQPKAYGGELLKTRKGRSQPRPIDTKNSMHLVLRSSKARGDWSFWKPKNKAAIQAVIAKFSQKYGVTILSMANVGNHLHFHLRLSNRYAYKKFIRAITSAIAMAVSGVSRWNRNGISTPGQTVKENEIKAQASDKRNAGKPHLRWKFWDYRPFTRVIFGLRAFLNLSDYVEINQLEGRGNRRPQAEFFVKWKRLGDSSYCDYPKELWKRLGDSSYCDHPKELAMKPQEGSKLWRHEPPREYYGDHVRNKNI